MKKGFTLIELICTIGILGIVFSITYPSMKYYLTKDNLKISTDRLVNDLRYAKLYAMSNKRAGVKVFFKPQNGYGYQGYTIVDSNKVGVMELKAVKFPLGVIISRESTFENGNISFGRKGNVLPHACTIILRDIDTKKEKRVTLTIDFSRIMVIDYEK